MLFTVHRKETEKKSGKLTGYLKFKAVMKLRNGESSCQVSWIHTLFLQEAGAHLIGET